MVKIYKRVTYLVPVGRKILLVKYKSDKYYMLPGETFKKNALRDLKKNAIDLLNIKVNKAFKLFKMLSKGNKKMKYEHNVYYVYSYRNTPSYNTYKIKDYLLVTKRNLKKNKNKISYTTYKILEKFFENEKEYLKKFNTKTSSKSRKLGFTEGLAIGMFT